MSVLLLLLFLYQCDSTLDSIWTGSLAADSSGRHLVVYIQGGSSRVRRGACNDHLWAHCDWPLSSLSTEQHSPTRVGFAGTSQSVEEGSIINHPSTPL